MQDLDVSKAVGYHYGAFPPKELDYARLIDPVARTASALTAYDQILARMHNSEFLLAPLRKQEAVVSSRMEGTISTLDEIMQIEAEEEGGQDDALLRARSEAVETLLHARAMQRVQRNMEDGQPLSEFQIRSTHQILLSYGRGADATPGSYKTKQNFIGERRRKEASFVPISPESLPAGMQSLMDFIRDNKVTPLLRIALSHVEFEALHPFNDGNGRIGRMIITLLLWNLGVIRAPHFYVSARFEELKDDYIHAMRRVSSHGAWTDWCVFFLQTLTEQAVHNIATAEKVLGLYDSMKLRFPQELGSQWAIAALDFMFANPTFRNNRFTHGAGIPPHVAMSMTRKLRDTGVLRQVRPGAGRRPAMYSFSPLMDIIRT